MTVLQIQMMLHYYAIAEPYAMRDPEHANSIAVHEQRYKLYEWGLIMPDNSPSGWYPTELGRKYIEELKAMPFQTA